MSKREEIRYFVERQARFAMYQHLARMPDRSAAETILRHVSQLASSVAFEIAEEYRFLELADIMEWKRTRVRR